MFRGLIDDAKSAATEVATRIATRAAIGVLFLLALGFGLAAITAMLVNEFGAVAAYWTVAAVFAALTVIGYVAVKWRDSSHERADADAEAHDTAHVRNSAAAQAAVQLPIALAGSLLTSSAGPVSIFGMMRFLGRNISLVVLLGLIGMLFWPTNGTAARRSKVPPPQPAE